MSVRIVLSSLVFILVSLACGEETLRPLVDGKAPLILRPLPGLPVIRDLVVDMTMFYQQYEKIKPYLINDSTPPEKERLQN